MKYFYINNLKFNYNLEFTTSSKQEQWKIYSPMIEYCETIGIDIPHYCYHKTLTISGNCRMCLIELKNSPKPVVSCALSAKACLNSGEIYTNSPLVKKARENILEFLLLNHPLDCPICDQGGECDLQDQSFFFGLSKKRFYNFKRYVTDKNIGPIVKTVMTRCIHCTRCVRFAKEIAGVEDLGVFGRGINSEIGTYVSKVFNSELSGNVIDLCPVGALTSKPYPFIGRSWELKNATTIDFSNGFGSNIEVFLKNNTIIKILPGHDPSIPSFNWISDKTRFAFDGMFSTSRLLRNYIVSDKLTILPITWRKLFTQICNILYFQDHLNKHFLKKNMLVICFGSTISLEILNLLLVFSKKYAFIQLKKVERVQLSNDFEYNVVNNLKDNFLTKINFSNLYVLLGINPRFEALPLQLKLRQRFLKGNFQIVSVGSFLDLTFPIEYVGYKVNVLRTIVEGNNVFCQDLLNSKIPVIIASSELMKRKDSKELNHLLHLLNLKLQSFHEVDNTIYSINTYINESGVNYLNNFDIVSEKDYKKTFAFYCINTSFTNPSLKKLINFKLLNLINENTKIPKYVLEQNGGFSSDLHNAGKRALNIYNFINIPNKVFFETSGTYLTTQGFFKKMIKILVSENQSKDNWQILRKVFSYTASVSYLSNSQFNHNINFNCKTITNFRDFTRFHFYATRNLIKPGIESTKVANFFIESSINYKIKRKKIFNTKLRFWLDDFYIGGSDHYSHYSAVMIQCSKITRLKSTNFTHVL